MISFELASQLLDPQSLKNKINELAVFQPKFISLTTHHPNLPALLQKLGPSPTPLMPHVYCINANKAQIKANLQIYQQLGINKLLVLRGDVKHPSELTDFNFAIDLIKFITQALPQDFELSIPAYPENPSDFKFLQEKIKAGAKRIITQYCYDLETIKNFHLQLENFKIPIHIGLMPPPKDFELLQKLSQDHQVKLPNWLKQAYQQNHVEPAFMDFIKELQNLNYNLQLFKVNALDTAKISRLLNTRPRV